MDFLNKFIEIALGRLTGGSTTASADQSNAGGLSQYTSYHGIGLSSLESVKMAYDSTNDENLSGREKGQRVTEGVYKLVGDWYTGGQVSPIMNNLDKNYPGVRSTVEKIDTNINPLANVFGRFFAPKGEKGLRNPLR